MSGVGGGTYISLSLTLSLSNNTTSRKVKVLLGHARDVTVSFGFTFPRTGGLSEAGDWAVVQPS